MSTTNSESGASLPSNSAAATIGAVASASPPVLGFSLSCLHNFLETHPSVITDELSTGGVCQTIVKQETAGTGRAYIHKWEGMIDAAGRPFTAPATIFLSQAWGYKFRAVIVDVMEQHEAEHPGSYFYFDLFNNDQNSLVDSSAPIDSLLLDGHFRVPLAAAGAMLLVLHPWNNPIPLSRAWCVFEIFTAIHASGVELTVKLPLADARALEESALASADSVVTALSDINVERAEAAVASDRDRILDAVRASPGGFDRVNTAVTGFLRSWITRQLTRLADSPTTAADSQLRLRAAIVRLSQAE